MSIVLEISTLDGMLGGDVLVAAVGKRVKDGRRRWRIGNSTLVVVMLVILSMLILGMTMTVLMLPKVVWWVVPMVPMVVVVISTMRILVRCKGWLIVINHGIVVTTQRGDERRDLAMMALGVGSIGMVLRIISPGMRYDGCLRSSR